MSSANSHGNISQPELSQGLKSCSALFSPVNLTQRPHEKTTRLPLDQTIVEAAHAFYESIS